MTVNNDHDGLRQPLNKTPFSELIDGAHYLKSSGYVSRWLESYTDNDSDLYDPPFVDTFKEGGRRIYFEFEVTQQISAAYLKGLDDAVEAVSDVYDGLDHRDHDCYQAADWCRDAVAAVRAKGVVK